MGLVGLQKLAEVTENTMVIAHLWPGSVCTRSYPSSCSIVPTASPENSAILCWPPASAAPSPVERHCVDLRVRTRRPKVPLPPPDRHDFAQAAWRPSSLPAWLTEETYLGRIQPLLAGITNKAVASALGTSVLYASAIRAGRRVPHPRHWQALAQLAGVTPDVGQLFGASSVQPS